MEKWKLSGYLEVEGVQGTINTFLIFWWGEPARLPQTGQKKIILTTMGSVMEVGVGISSSLMGTEREDRYIGAGLQSYKRNPYQPP